jgi:hypothetical protein
LNFSNIISVKKKDFNIQRTEGRKWKRSGKRKEMEDETEKLGAGGRNPFGGYRNNHLFAAGIRIG